MKGARGLSPSRQQAGDTSGSTPVSSDLRSPGSSGTHLQVFVRGVKREHGWTFPRNFILQEIPC